MRKIKFRGYAKEELVGSQWVYGFGVEKVEYTDGTSDAVLFTDSSPIIVLEDSVGQWIERNDKNGKEIFEGHVVSIDCGGYKVNEEVRYIKGCHNLQEGSEEDFEIVGDSFVK